MFGPSSAVAPDGQWPIVLASFLWACDDRHMPASDPKLTAVAPADIAESISHALLFSGRKRIHESDRLTASIAADRIVRHLENCGYADEKAALDWIGAAQPARELSAY